MPCKSKAVPLHTTEALGGRGKIAPIHSCPRYLIGVSGHRHGPIAFNPRGKDLRYPMDRRLGVVGQTNLDLEATREIHYP